MRQLDSSIEVLAGTDIADVWDRFEVFEALHHTMEICNPMTSAQLDETVQALAPRDGTIIYDVACGYGELLFRVGEAASVRGIGIDLSPWMVTAAHQTSAIRAPNSTFSWVLGEARDYVPPTQADVVICIGAEWVWHDFKGTARAVASRLQSGGMAVIGAARLHSNADPDRVARERGQVDTIDDMRAILERQGLRPLHRIDPDDAGWDNYLERTASAASAWAQLHPGSRADRWLEEQADWQAARERDRDVIGWSLWMAHKQ